MNEPICNNCKKLKRALKDLILLFKIHAPASQGMDYIPAERLLAELGE